MVCSDCWEPRHPQEFIRVLNTQKKLPYIRADVEHTLSYTPAWGLVSSLGDGTLEGKYTQTTDSNGDSVIQVTISAQIGSTTTFNSGNWTLSIPVTNGVKSAEGFAELIAKNKTYIGIVSLAASGTTLTIRSQLDNKIWSNTIPLTWSEGDRLFLTIRYSTQD